MHGCKWCRVWPITEPIIINPKPITKPTCTYNTYVAQLYDIIKQTCTYQTRPTLNNGMQRACGQALLFHAHQLRHMKVAESSDSLVYGQLLHGITCSLILQAPEMYLGCHTTYQLLERAVHVVQINVIDTHTGLCVGIPLSHCAVHVVQANVLDKFAG